MYDEYDPVNTSGAEPYDRELFGDYTTNRQETIGSHWLCALAAAGLACVLSLICAVMAWVLFDHWKNPWMLALAIISTLAVFIFAFCAFWSFTNNKKRSGDAEYHPSSFMELIVWILGLLMMVFFLVAGIAMFLYMPFHEAYMREMKSDSDYWSRKWGKDFDTEWKQEKDQLIVLAAFSLIIGACMIVFAFNVFTMSIKKYNLSVTMFLLAALAAFCFAFGVIVHHQDIKWWTSQYRDQSSFLPYKTLLYVIFVLAIIVLVLTFLNVLLTYLRRQFFYYVFLFLILMACVIGAICLAEYGKTMRKNITPNMWNSGRDILSQTHMDVVPKFCEHAKYVDSSSACTQSDLANRWESGNSGTFALNQKCYGDAGRFFPWKYFVMFLLIAFMVMFLALLALMNLFLLRDSNTEKPNNLYLAVVGIMALLGLALGLYLIFGYGEPEQKTSAGFVQSTNSKFVSVDKDVSALPPKTTKMCSMNSKLNAFKLTGDQNEHGRLAILLQNGEIKHLGSSDLGSSGRLHFFNDTNKNNNFYLLKGTQKEINDSLEKTEWCINKSSHEADAYFKYEKVPSADLLATGLRNGENPNMPYLTDNGTNYNGSLVNRSRECKSTCSVGLDLSSNSKQLFVIPLVVQNKDGSPGIYTLPELGLRAEILDENHNHLGYGVITQKSEIAFQANTYTNMNYNLLVKTTDTNDYYTTNIVKAQIPAKEQIDSKQTSVVLPLLVLLTKDGKGCAGDTQNYQNCIQNGKNDWKEGSIVVNTIDAVSGKELDEEVLVSKYHADDKYVQSSQTTSNGSASFNNLKYGAYNVVSTNPKYEVNPMQVSLQSDSQNVNLFLVPVDDDKQRISSVNNVNNSDFDLSLEMENASGDSCTVNAWNRECPGASLVADYVKNNNRVQMIDIDTYKKANYMLYYAPNFKTSGNCVMADNFNSVQSKSTSSRRLEGWNLSSFSSFFSMLNPVSIFDSGMNSSVSTNNEFSFSPFNPTKILNPGPIIPLIGKEPNYPAILGMINHNYSSDSDRNSMLGALTVDEDERSQIALTGEQIYRDQPSSGKTSWLQDIGMAFGGSSWTPNPEVEVGPVDTFAQDDLNFNFEGSDQDYFAQEGSSEESIWSVKEDENSWFCEILNTCSEEGQTIGGTDSGEVVVDDGEITEPVVISDDNEVEDELVVPDEGQYQNIPETNADQGEVVVPDESTVEETEEPEIIVDEEPEIIVDEEPEDVVDEVQDEPDKPKAEIEEPTEDEVVVQKDVSPEPTEDEVAVPEDTQPVKEPTEDEVVVPEDTTIIDEPTEDEVVVPEDTQPEEEPTEDNVVVEDTETEPTEEVAVPEDKPTTESDEELVVKDETEPVEESTDEVVVPEDTEPIKEENEEVVVSDETEPTNEPTEEEVVVPEDTTIIDEPTEEKEEVEEVVPEDTEPEKEPTEDEVVVPEDTTIINEPTEDEGEVEVPEDKEPVTEENDEVVVIQDEPTDESSDEVVIDENPVIQEPTEEEPTEEIEPEEEKEDTEGQTPAEEPKEEETEENAEPKDEVEVIQDEPKEEPVVEDNEAEPTEDEPVSEAETPKEEEAKDEPKEETEVEEEEPTPVEPTEEVVVDNTEPTEEPTVPEEKPEPEKEDEEVVVDEPKSEEEKTDVVVVPEEEEPVPENDEGVVISDAEPITDSESDLEIKPAEEPVPKNEPTEEEVEEETTKEEEPKEEVVVEEEPEKEPEETPVVQDEPTEETPEEKEPSTEDNEESVVVDNTEATPESPEEGESPEESDKEEEKTPADEPTEEPVVSDETNTEPEKPEEPETAPEEKPETPTEETPEEEEEFVPFVGEDDEEVKPEETPENTNDENNKPEEEKETEPEEEKEPVTEEVEEETAPTATNEESPETPESTSEPEDKENEEKPSETPTAEDDENTKEAEPVEEDTTTEKPVEEATTIKPEPEETTPEEEKTPEESAPEPVEEDTTEKEKTPEESTPEPVEEDTSEEEKTPEETTPEEKTPEEKTPEETAPEENTPEEKNPEETTPEPVEEDTTEEEKTPEESKPEPVEEDTTEEEKTPEPVEENDKPEEPVTEETTESPEEAKPEETTPNEKPEDEDSTTEPEKEPEVATEEPKPEEETTNEETPNKTEPIVEEDTTNEKDSEEPETTEEPEPEKTPTEDEKTPEETTEAEPVTEDTTAPAEEPQSEEPTNNEEPSTEEPTPNEESKPEETITDEEPEETVENVEPPSEEPKETEAESTPEETPETTPETPEEAPEESTPEPTTEENKESSTEPTTEDTAEPVTEDTTEETPEPTTEPTTEENARPVTEDTEEKTNEDTNEPVTEDTKEKTAEPTTEDTTEPTTEPTTEDTTEPTTEDTTEPTTEDTTEPTTEDTTEPTTEPTTEDTTEPTTEETKETTPVPTPDVNTQPTTEENTEPTDPADEDLIFKYLVQLDSVVDKNKQIDNTGNRILAYIRNLEKTVQKTSRLSNSAKQNAMRVLAKVKKSNVSSEMKRNLVAIKQTLTKRILSTSNVQRNRYRKLASDKKEYRLVRCFTGYGFKSTKYMNMKMTTKPAMSLCKKELDSSKYSLAHLNRER